MIHGRRRPITMHVMMCLLFLLLFVVESACSDRERVRNIAIFPFDLEMNTFLYRWLSKGVPEAVADKLSVIESLDVVTWDMMSASAGTLERSLENGISAEEAIRLANIGLYDLALVGRVNKYGADLTISGDLIDVRYGKILFTFSSTDKFGIFFDIVNSFVFGIVKQLGLEIDMSQIQEIEKKPTRSFMAFRWYQDALMLFDTAGSSESLEVLTLFLEKTIEWDPMFVKPHYHLAEAYYLRENFPEAERQYRIALNLDPLYTDASVGLAKLYFKKGEYSKVVGEISRVQKTNPPNPDALYYLGVSFFQLKDYPRAEPPLRKYLDTSRFKENDADGRRSRVSQLLEVIKGAS